MGWVRNILRFGFGVNSGGHGQEAFGTSIAAAGGSGAGDSREESKTGKGQGPPPKEGRL